VGPTLAPQQHGGRGVRVLVTGGAGFIGHHLVRALLERDDSVAIIDDMSTGLAGRLDGLNGNVDLVVGDIRDPQAMRRAAAGAEVIFHQAALPSVARSVADPATSTSVNVDGTVQVMLAAIAARTRRVVLAGSSSIYGISPELPRRETQTPDPRSPYAASKVAAEYMVHSIGALHGVETAVLRYFNVFGPGQDPNSQYAAVVPLWITAALEGKRPIVFGDGTASRDFTYIDNVVSANLKAAVAGAPSRITVNVGCGDEFSLMELLDAIGEAAGMRLEPVFQGPRPGDVPRSRADISAAQAAIGYEVLVPFREGVARTFDWYRSDRAAAAEHA